MRGPETTRPDLGADALAELARKLADEGKLVESGFAAYRRVVVPRTAPMIQVEETRRAFFAGAQHVFASMVGMMTADEEPTEADMRRMDSLNDEMERFVAEMVEATARRNRR